MAGQLQVVAYRYPLTSSLTLNPFAITFTQPYPPFTPIHCISTAGLHYIIT